MEAIDYKKRSRIAFDNQAATYDADMKGAHARALYAHVLAELSGAPDAKVLDVGCGTGALAKRVLERTTIGHLTGIDLSVNMVAQAAAMIEQEGLADRATILEGDSENLPFHDESFDAIICNDSFHHYPDPRKAVFEAWRVLRPGGLYVIGDCTLPAPARALMNGVLEYAGEGDVHLYSQCEFEALLGTWFSSVAWRRAESTSCVVKAVK